MNYQLIIAGIGGQGVLFAAKVLTETARRKKLRILGSQTFGMAQRGGSVMTHLKIGDFAGPLVCEGDANLLLGLDCVEAHRNLGYLQAAKEGRGALCVVNVSPQGAFPSAAVADLLEELGVVSHVCNADGEALALGNPLLANLVLLGFGSRQAGFPFGLEDLREATAALSGAAAGKLNLAALERGAALC